MENELEKIFSEARKNIGKALEPDLRGEYDMNDMYVLIEDLAHTGGKNTSPISIMGKGTIFYKKKDSEYYCDGFHLILGRICKNFPKYFQKLTTT